MSKVLNKIHDISLDEASYKWRKQAIIHFKKAKLIKIQSQSRGFQQ